MIRGVDNGRGEHWDLYTDDLIPLTVDHIIPKSLGGANDMSNYQPMCFPCNNKKGNGKNQTRKKKYNKNNFKEVKLTNYTEAIGIDIWRIVGTKTPRHLGIAEGASTNPHTLQTSLTITRGDKISYFDLGKSLYIKLS